jgi:CRISPR/Cas system CSM-associated protein Csm3 (group 7 of RAMP superfamily)
MPSSHADTLKSAKDPHLLPQTSRTRYVISARLVTKSPLAIHGGLSTHDLRAMGRFTEEHFREPFAGIHEGVKDCDALVVRDWNGLPYIPGSSLKGVFREYLTQGKNDSALNDALKWLLGRAAEKDDEGEGGAAIFEDAFLELPENFYEDCDTPFAHLPFWNPEQLTYVEQHTSINRRTGAVNFSNLFNVEVVPAGLSFDVRFVVDHGQHSMDGVKHLLKVLAAFNLDLVHGPPRLGSSTSNGWGRMSCEPDSVKVTRWTPTRHTDLTIEEFDTAKFMKEFQETPPLPKRRRVSLSLSLNFNSAFITADPGKAVSLIGVKSNFLNVDSHDSDRKPADLVPRVTQCHLVEISGDSKEAGSDGEPQTVFHATPLLPATGFRGAFRSQLEKILRTIHPGIGVSPHGQLEEVSKSSEEFVKRLFGMESKKSGLWCCDFVGTQELPLHLRERVAIDRFASSVAGSAKYNIMVFESPTLKGELAVDLPADDQQAQKLLGAFVLGMRDLIEGDISFGYGDMIGFGQCTARVTALRSSHGPQLGITDSHIEMCHRVLISTEDDNDRIELDKVLDSFLVELRR